MSNKLNKNSVTPESGFTLIEMLVSVVIFLIFISAVYGLLRIGTIQKTTISAQTDLIKNARLSINTIGRDAVNAGFGYSRVGGYAPDNLTNLRMNLPADADSEQDVITAIISGNNINANDFLFEDKTDVVSFIYRDISWNDGNPITLTDSAKGSGNSVKLTTSAADAAVVKPFDLFLISDGVRTALGLVTSKNGNELTLANGGSDPLQINATYNGLTETRSRLRKCSSPTENSCFDYSSIVTAKKINWVSYSVTQDGTLIRTIFGNNTGQDAENQIQIQPIAFNVINLQIQYLLRNGTTSDDPSNGGSNATNLNNIVQITVNLSTQVTIREQNVELKKVINLNSTFSTKNLSYDIS